MAQTNRKHEESSMLKIEISRRIQLLVHKSKGVVGLQGSSPPGIDDDNEEIPPILDKTL